MDVEKKQRWLSRKRKTPLRDTGDVKPGKLFHIADGMIIECFKRHREKMCTLEKDFH